MAKHGLPTLLHCSKVENGQNGHGDPKMRNSKEIWGFSMISSLLSPYWPPGWLFWKLEGSLRVNGYWHTWILLEYQWVSLQEMINDLFGRFLHISIYVVYARLLGSWHTCTSSHWPWTPKKNRAPPLLTFRELAKPWRWLWISQGINMF